MGSPPGITLFQWKTFMVIKGNTPHVYFYEKKTQNYCDYNKVFIRESLILRGSIKLNPLSEHWQYEAIFLSIINRMANQIKSAILCSYFGTLVFKSLPSLKIARLQKSLCVCNFSCNKPVKNQQEAWSDVDL